MAPVLMKMYSAVRERFSLPSISTSRDLGPEKDACPRISSRPSVLSNRFSLSNSIDIRFFQAGHVLGAASIEVIVKTSQGEKVIVFSGDLGPDDNPLHFAPEKQQKADYALVPLAMPSLSGPGAITVIIVSMKIVPFDYDLTW